MTKKEPIIIDGVDVVGCKYFNRFRSICHNKNLCCDCEKNQDCYFKQLARKTQECEELENKIKKLRKNLALEIETNDRYRKVIEEIKEECDYAPMCDTEFSERVLDIINIIKED